MCNHRKQHAQFMYVCIFMYRLYRRMQLCGFKTIPIKLCSYENVSNNNQSIVASKYLCYS